MRKNSKTTTRPVGAHDSMWVRTWSAGVLLCSLCGAAPLSAAGVRSPQVLTPPANGAAISPQSKRSGPVAAISSEPPQAGKLTRELWSSRITAPDPNEDAETRLALKRLIQQVRSVRFGSETSPPAAALPVETQTTALPQVEFAPGPPAKPPAATASVPTNAQVGSSPSAGQRKKLEGLLQDPGRTSDPLEIAELLFLSGRPADAAPFYAQALERLPAGDATVAADRAWTLFQLANCLRETDVKESQATYAKLISEYPDSPWTELARAQSQLLSWYQKDRPQQLVVSRRP